MKQRILFDCDPGLDDAVALLAALGSPELDVVAITTVAGNVAGPQTAENARTILALTPFAREISVSGGAPEPLLRTRVSAEAFHGSEGLGHLRFPKPSRPLSRAHSVNQIMRLCSQTRDNPLTLVVTGPLTNLALALTMDPSLAEGIDHVALMGGADRAGGNITPHAEFNIFADPHAAEKVFTSGLQITCYGLDVTHQVRCTPERIAAMVARGCSQALAAADLIRASNALEQDQVGKGAAPLHDPCPVIGLVYPDLFQTKRVSVSVDTHEGERFGQTRLTETADGNVDWVVSADADGVFAALNEMIAGFER